MRTVFFYAKFILIIILFMCGTSLASAASITGYVQDVTTGKPIGSAEISLLIGNKQLLSQSDDNGNFFIEMPGHSSALCMVKINAKGYNSDTKFFTIEADKDYEIGFYVQDNIPPTIDELLIETNPGDPSDKNIILNISALDDGSGLFQISTSVDGINWSDPEPFTVKKKLELTESPKNIYLRVQDAAGNWSYIFSKPIYSEASESQIDATKASEGYAENTNEVSDEKIGENRDDVIASTKNDNPSTSNNKTTPINPPTLSGTIIVRKTIKNVSPQPNVTSSNETVTAAPTENLNTAVTNPAIATDDGSDLKNLSAEEVIARLADNYKLVYDIKADMTFDATFNGQPFGETDYCMYYFMGPNKGKIETYATEERCALTEIRIIDGPNMFLVNPDTKEIETVDLLTEANINSDQMNQMDIWYNAQGFLESHSVSKDETASDYANGIVVVEAAPKKINTLYGKLRLYIDYNKGLMVKSLLYRDGNLKQIIEYTETQQMPNGAWIPKTIMTKPIISSGEFATTAKFENISINIGLTDLDFKPERQ